MKEPKVDLKVSIDPMTRLEGHGKIEIFLDEKGNVKEAYMQTPELRGFEVFCRGRRAEDMPIITSRICGVCPEAHLTASAKALDMAFGAEPPQTARMIRELLYNAYIFYDHCLNLYYLGGIDLLLGDVERKERNIIGLINKFGIEIGKEIIKHRRYAMEIVKTIGGREIHPVSVVPGGVSKRIQEEERKEIEKKAESCITFARRSLEIFKKLFSTEEWNQRLGLDSMNTYYMGMVDSANHVNFYDGDVRIVSPSGDEFARIKPEKILDHIEEHVEGWSYVKFPYLKGVGWRGLVDGENSGIYRVGSLARLNSADGMNTSLAMKEFQEFKKKGLVNQTFGYYHARLIEMLNAAERVHERARDDQLTGKDIRSMPSKPGEGVGVVEAARGTLIHHYKLNSEGLVKDANLIVATTNNNAAMNISVANAARRVIENGTVNDAILNRIESAVRCYDPCLACASHSLGSMPMVVNVYWKGRLHKRLQRNA